MSDKHAQMREMARGLIRDSVIEDAIAQKIAQIIAHIYDAHIKPLQERVEVLERERALDGIAAIEEDAPQKQVHWANDYGSYSKSWHKSRNHADEAAIGPPIEIGPRIAVIRREWVEGQPPRVFHGGSVMGWQPIETAPKDGTPHVRGLWVYDATSGHPLYWQVDAGYEHEDGDWILSDGDTSGWQADDYSHWMPLPEPPKEDV